MFCPRCGKPVVDGARFCGSCGQPMGGEGTTTPEARPVAANGGADRDSAAPAAGSQATAQPQPQYQQSQAQAQYQPQPMPVAPPQPGCLGSAWHDITSSPNWVKRILLLMVMKCVPILGFYVTGYGLEWSADAARGSASTQLPQGNFSKRTFLTGLFAAILGLLFAVANTWLLALVVVPILCWVIAIAVLIFGSALYALACVRIALFGKFGQAFQLSDLFSTYKRGIGSLLAAVVLPGIIMNAMYFLLALLVGGGTVAGLSSASMYGRAYGAVPILPSASTIFGVGALLVALGLVGQFLNGFAEIWSFRAAGIWVWRNAPEWASQAQSMASAPALETAARMSAANVATTSRP